jgi:DNA-binding Lrp family transcriptional regulator
VNPAALGKAEYSIFLSLARGSSPERSQLIEDLVRCPAIDWVAELGGGFDLGATIATSSPLELRDFINDLSHRYLDLIKSKWISSILGYAQLGRKYLAPQVLMARLSVSPGAKGTVELDELDRGILQLLLKNPEAGPSQVGRSLGLPINTIIYRMERLQANGIIVGFNYFVNANRLGMLSYKILLTVRGLLSSFQKSFQDFARAHPNVYCTIEHLGSWDYELCIEVVDPHEATLVMRDIDECLSPHIASSALISVLRVVKHYYRDIRDTSSELQEAI